MRARNNLRRHLLATAGLASLIVGFAADRAAAADGIETVTVTARRQEETLMDAPVTVTALTGEDLRDRGITDIQAIIQFVPNATVPDDPQHFTTFINIRGIRQVDAQSEPNVGIYRNGLYYGGQRTNFGSLVDLNRIEILRGPQAGLYGRDAVGGSVNIIYNMPDANPGGYASGTYASYNRVELEGAYTVPLSDMFSVRAAGWYFNQTGSEYYNSFLNENIDRGHDIGGRLSGKLDWTSNLSTVVTFEYEDVTGPSQRTYAPNGVPGVLNGVLSAPETPRTIQRDTPNRSQWDQFYVAQTTSYDSDAGRFSLMASYRDYKLDGIEDQDQSTVDPAAAFLNLKQVLTRDEGVKDFYVEGLWTSPQDQPVTFMAGVSYFDETFDFARTFITSLDLTVFGSPGVGTAQGGLPLKGTNFKTQSVSAFGEFTWHATDTVDIIGGLRWTQDNKKLDYAQGIIPTNPATDPIFSGLFATVLPPFTLTDTPKFTFAAPSLTLRWTKSDDFMLYASFNSGFRAGGFNTTTTVPALIPYDQETAFNYEVGVKTLWLDGNLGINADVFMMDQHNMLLAQPDPISPPAFGFTFLSNIGSAQTLGAELEVQAHFNDWLSGFANLGLLDPHFTRGSSFGTVLNGKMIPYTRDMTFNIGLDLDAPVSEDVAVVGTVTYRAERGGYLDTANTSTYEDFDKIDATAGIEFWEDTRLVGYVKNLTDDRVVQFEFGNGAVATNLGRTYGIQLSKKF